MSRGLVRSGNVRIHHHPVKLAVLSFAHGPAIARRHDLAEKVETVRIRQRRRDDGFLPVMPAIQRTKHVPAQRGKISREKSAFHPWHNIGPYERPTVTGAQYRMIAQLHHARILRAAKWMRVNQLRLLAPGFSAVPGSNQD